MKTTGYVSCSRRSESALFIKTDKLFLLQTTENGNCSPAVMTGSCELSTSQKAIWPPRRRAEVGHEDVSLAD